MRNRFAVYACLVLQVIVAPCALIAQAQSADVPIRSFPATWQTTLDGFSSSGKIPGAVIIVTSPSWGVRVGVTGYADLHSKKPMTPELPFRIGSVTKTFVAQIVLELEQEGRIKLTDPIVKYLGDDPNVTAIPYIRQITIHELLQMTSGITNYLANAQLDTYHKINYRHWTPNDLIAMVTTGTNSQGMPMTPDYVPRTTYANPYCAMFGDKPGSSTCPVKVNPPEEALNVPFPPFPYWYYTNSNYILLGMLVEKVTEHSLAEEVQIRIAGKLGLTHTYLAMDDKVPADMMHGYTKLDALLQPNPSCKDWCDVTNTNPSYAWAAGAVISNAWDLLHYLNAMLKYNELLNPGTKEKWLRFADADIHFFNTEYGVGGLMQSNQTYGTVRGHGGAFPGFKTLIYRFFDDDTDFVLGSNTWDGQEEVAMLDAIGPLVKGAVTEPTPGEKTTASFNPDGTVDFRWQAGVIYGDGYKLYIGRDAGHVDSSSKNPGDTKIYTTTSPSLRVPDLKPNTTYYWRVDTTSGDGVTLVNGPLWSFQTAAGRHKR